VRLAVSSIVKGSQRIPSRVRNQPLKSIDHSPFGALAPATMSPCAALRRRRSLGSIKPPRFGMAPIVEAAGHITAGCAAMSLARIFFGPTRGNRSRMAMIAAISDCPVACGHVPGARERSSNQRSSPLARRRFQT